MTTRPRKYRFLFASELTGGNRTLFANLRDAVGEMGDIDATWLPIESDPPEWFARVPPISMNWSLKGGLVTRKRVLALDRARHFDAAFFNHQVIALWLGRFRGRVPSVITMDHTPLCMDAFAGVYGHSDVAPGVSAIQDAKRRLTTRVYASASALLPWSTWVARSLVDDYGMPEDKVWVTPPGIDLRTWRPPDTERSTSASSIKVLFVGYEFERKGGDLLESAAREPDLAGCEFHFVTETYTGAGGPNIFVHEHLKPNSAELLALARAADVFVLPTRGDLHSVASLEAMAMGLPVISTRVGGIPDIVEDGTNGFLIEPDDRAQLVDRLRRIVTEPERRLMMGIAARRTVERRFDLDTIAGFITDHMRQAADGRRALAEPVGARRS